MHQAVVQRQAVQEGLERGARRTRGPHHVHVAQAGGVGELQRAHVGPRFQRGVVHHQQRRRRALGQLREIAGQALFQHALQRGVQRAADARAPRVGRAQALGQQRRRHGRLQAARHHRFDARIVHLRGGPHAQRGHARQHLVARGARGLGVAVGAQPAGRLRQHRQQRGFGLRQARCRLAQIGPACRLHAHDGAAEGRMVEIQRKDFVLRVAPLQLQRAQRLAQLAQRRARMRLQDAGHLHGERGAARHHAAIGRPLPGRAQHGRRIHAGMPAEPAVFIRHQRLQVVRRHLVHRDRVAPHALAVGEGAQRRAVGGQHHGPAVAGVRNGRREQAIECERQQQQQRERRQRAAPARARPAQGRAGQPRRGRRRYARPAHATAGRRSPTPGWRDPRRAARDGTCPPPAAAAPRRCPASPRAPGRTAAPSGPNKA